MLGFIIGQWEDRIRVRYSSVIRFVSWQTCNEWSDPNPIVKGLIRSIIFYLQIVKIFVFDQECCT